MKSASVFLFCLCICSFSESRANDTVDWRNCVEIAKKNNPQLVSAREKILQNKADAGIARSALLPNVSIDANGTKQRSGNVNSNSYYYGVTGKQALFDGENYFAVKKTGELVNTAYYQYRIVSSNLRLNLRMAYVNLLKSQEQLKIVNDIWKLREKNYRLVKMMHQAGREHRGALLTAEANMAQARFEVTQAHRNLRAAQRQLIYELGLKNFALLKVDGKFDYHATVDKNPDFEALANKNPLLQEIISVREAARYNLQAAKMSFFPKVYGFLSAGRNGKTLMPRDNELSAGVQMNLTFEGGKQIYQTKKADAQLRQLDADTLSTKSSIVLTLEEKWIQLLNKKDTVNVQQKFLAATQERAKIAEAQYSVGLINFDTWIIIEDALVKAMKSYLDAKAEALYADAEWIQAKGETLDYDN